MKSLFLYTALFLSSSLPLVFASHITPIHRRGKHLRRKTCAAVHNSSTTTNPPTNPPSSGCFPSLGFQMPSNVPSTLNGWWCDASTEYAFLGFSYEVTACQSLSQLQTDFLDIRNRYKSRYVRLYGACDRNGFYDDIVSAAWDAGVGVHALIWFGFDGSNQWQTRRDSLFNTLQSNPKAKFVTRVVQFGSEPLYDHVLSPQSLTTQVNDAKSTLASLNIPVTVSDMAYGYQSNGGAQDVLDAIDIIDAHMLPFFAAQSTTGANAWSYVQTNMDWFISMAPGKKIIFSENGWPSQQTANLQPNSKAVVGSVWNMEGYFNMLDSHCADLKAVQGGGAGWFFHLYSDSMELGYGLLDTSGNPKFAFAPQTSC